MDFFIGPTLVNLLELNYIGEHDYWTVLLNELVINQLEVIALGMKLE